MPNTLSRLVRLALTLLFVVGAAKPKPADMGSCPSFQKTSSNPCPAGGAKLASHSKTTTPPREVPSVGLNGWMDAPAGADGGVGVQVGAGVAVSVGVGVQVEVDVGNGVGVDVAVDVAVGANVGVDVGRGVLVGRAVNVAASEVATDTASAVRVA